MTLLKRKISFRKKPEKLSFFMTAPCRIKKDSLLTDPYSLVIVVYEKNQVMIVLWTVNSDRTWKEISHNESICGPVN